MSDDSYWQPVKCPQCNAEAMVNVVENDGYSYAFGSRDKRIEKVPQPFQLISANDLTFKCKACNVEAISK
jgi:hypothetical protein